MSTRSMYCCLSMIDGPKFLSVFRMMMDWLFRRSWRVFRWVFVRLGVRRCLYFWIWRFSFWKKSLMWLSVKASARGG